MRLFDYRFRFPLEFRDRLAQEPQNIIIISRGCSNRSIRSGLLGQLIEPKHIIVVGQGI
jgi:hypothetical protein